MATITERGGRYFARVRIKGFPTASKTFTRRTDAAAWARKTQSDMESGRWQAEAEGVPSFKEAVGEYRRTVAVKMKGADTYAYRFDMFESLSFASKPVNEVTSFDLSRWRDDLAKTRKPATVVRLLAMLSAIFTWAAKERGWLSQNPAAMVARPRVTDRRERVLSVAEQGYILQAADTSKATWLPAALTLLMSSAMRRGELFGLRRCDVNLAARVAHLPTTKNGSARDVPLCPEAMAALETLMAAAGRGADVQLLPVGEAGSVSTRFAVTLRRARRAYEADCDAAGEQPEAGFLQDVRLHDLRHHAITRWASTGALSVLQLQAISGHKSPNMLARYTHLSASALAERMAAVAESVKAAQSAMTATGKAQREAE